MPKRKTVKLKPGHVIRLLPDMIADIGGDYLRKYPSWIVMRIDGKASFADDCVRLRPTTGGIAMTEWLHLYDDEYEIDVFLSAAYQSQKKANANYNP